MREQGCPRSYLRRIRTLCALSGNWLEVVERLEHLVGTRANSDAVRQVHPADGACGINEEFGGTGDIGALRSSALVQEAKTSDHLRLRVRKESESEAQLLAVLARHLRGVRADGDHTDTACVEVGESMLETPQLGVTKRSPMAAVEYEQCTAGFWTRSAVRPGPEQFRECHCFAVLV